MESEGGRKLLYENKINLLRAVTGEVSSLEATGSQVGMDSDSRSTQLRTLLRNEITYAQVNQKALDILEICSGETLGMVGILLSNEHLQANDSGPKERTVFLDESTKQARDFLDELESLIDTGTPETIAYFLTNRRKNMGFCTDSEHVVRLGQLLVHLYRGGLLEKDSLTIAHYPGSFNPFPHVGHVEVAEQVTGSLLSTGITNPRVVVSTITQSDQKSIGDNFSDRVDNLVRGFVDHEYISVLGVPSDLTEQKDVVEFRQLVAKLDSHGKARHVMGSDTLLSRIAKAREGDVVSNYLINTGNTIFLSIRAGEDPSAMRKALDTVHDEFDCEVVVLPAPTYDVSGIMIRGLDRDTKKQYAPSSHVIISD